jgi:hypothetical protein
MTAKVPTMQYLLLIYVAEKAWAAMSDDERNALYTEYRAFTHQIQDSGQWVGGNPLQPTHTATTVRVRDGKASTTDGPFAETREQLGGYYLVEAKDLDEATRLAARIPGARMGSIEVRPVMKVGP